MQLFIKNILFQQKFHASWVVLLIDFFVITFSLLISILVEHEYSFQHNYGQFATLYLMTTIIILLLFQVNSRIIRYSNTDDILKIFLAILMSNVTFIIIWLAKPGEISTPVLLDFSIILLVNFFISSSLLISLRLLIKSIYRYISEPGLNPKRENVLIYGSKNPSILIKKALESQQDLPTCIKGFIDNGKDAINKHIEQTNVYAVDSIANLKQRFDIKKLMVTSGDLMDDGKKKAITSCIALDISVIIVAPPDQWLNGQPNSNQFQNLKIEDLLERQPIELCKKDIWEGIRGKRVLITGAAGSIGSELVRQILNYSPLFVVLCDQAETPLHDIRLELEDNLENFKNVEFFVTDICNKSRLEALFNLHKPQIVFHAAAYKHVPMMENNPMAAVLTNIGGTKNMADMALAYDVEKFIMISTDKAVRPTNIMGATKRIAEMYIQSLNLSLISVNYLSSGKYLNRTKRTKYITTRFGNVLGSNGSVIPRFKAQIEKGGPITVTHPEITRYFMTIPEAVQLVLEAAIMGKGGEIFLFDMGNAIKISDLAVSMIKLAGFVPHRDIEIIYSGLRPGEKLYEELLNDSEEVLPTHHKDIKISKTIPLCHQKIAQLVEELLEITKLNDPVLMVAKMKLILPEFISKNSIYEALDRKEIAASTVA